MDGLWGSYANWNASDGERWILYDLIYVWNLKKSGLLDTRSRLVVAKGLRWELENVMRVVTKHTLPVTGLISSGRVGRCTGIVVNTAIAYARKSPRLQKGFPAAQWSRIHLQCGSPGFDPWVGKIPWRGKWQPTPVFLPGEFHGLRRAGGLKSMGSQRVRHNWVTNTWSQALKLKLWLKNSQQTKV